MIRCQSCHHDNSPGTKFCGECGARFALTCASCGASNPPANRFCGECGTALTSASGVPTPDAAPGLAGSQAYTPKHLAERILTSRTALEGERKQVTVLFADLKGSMELLADRDPEQARKLLDPVLEHMMEAVHRYEGTVNQVMGDGIMALFGAPLAHEDHAVRACYAALRMQESVKQYAQDIRRVEGIPIRIRVGLNSGEVVVRAIGSDLHMDYTAVGQTTHLAARMEQIAAPETIAVTPATVALAEGFVEVRSLGPTAVKGLSEPVEVFELLRGSAVRSRLQAVAARGLTRFVGRSVEMAQLHDGLDRARAGRGQVVALVGEPGAGKSRIVWEFTRSHRTDGCLVLEAPSVSYGKATAYLPVIELLKRYFGIDPRDDARTVREKATGKLLALDRALEASLPALLALLDVPVEDDAWSRLDPRQRRQRTLDGIRRLLLRESQVRPLVLVFEDLHWIDGETQALLELLVDGVPTARVLLLVNYRPEYQHPWGSKTYYHQLTVEPLTDVSAQELLDDLLGQDGEIEQLKRLLVERTEGNPFFMEETVRNLAEAGVLTGQRGAYRLAGPVQTLTVPATAQAVLAARIDRLDPDDKRRLQTAAVVGHDVPLVVLQAISDEDGDALRAGVARLQAAEFLYESRLFPDVEYTFKHALTHDVAYGGLLLERRRAVHGRIVDAMETLLGDRTTDHLDSLAYHAFRGERWEAATRYAVLAGERTTRLSAYGDAIVAFDRALEALTHLPDTPDFARTAIDIRFSLRMALVAVGEYSRLLDELRVAETIARRIGDLRRLGQVESYLAYYCALVGDLGQAVELGRRASAAARTVDDHQTLVSACLYLSRAYFARAEYERAVESATEVIAAASGDRLYEHLGITGLPSVGARTWLACAYAELGRFTDARDAGETALEIARRAEHPYSIVFPCFALGLLHLRQGTFDTGIRVVEDGFALCQSQAISGLFPTIASHLGAMYAHVGRLAEAVALLEQSRERADALGLKFGQSTRLGWLGESYLLLDRVEQARRWAEESLALARTRGERGQQAWTLQILGAIGARAVPGRMGGEDHYREALALGQQLGMRPLVAHCHAGLGKLYVASGKAERAQPHVMAAATMFREMGMTHALECLARQ